MLTETKIEQLISAPKQILQRVPASGYEEVGLHRRGALDLTATNDDGIDRFSVFIRQNLHFTENFSVGLRWHSNDPVFGRVTLVRYNGPHGETSRQPDGHFAQSHIHRITAQEIQRGSRQPREEERRLTDRYSTLESALRVFFRDTAVTNVADYFDELSQLELFHDC